MRPLFRSSLLVVMLLILVSSHAQHRILFLGNSITYDGRYIVDLETWLLVTHPKEHALFINAGLPSETVSGLSEEGHAGGRFPRPDLHERLARVLAAAKPDVVFVDYGMNDGIYLPWDSSRAAAYRNGMNWLYGELKKTGAEIYMVTPPVHDDPLKGLDGYDLVLDEYSRWILQQQQAQGWQVIDIHFPMKAFLEKQRKKDPGFKLAEDGVHPNDLGHWLMAKQIIRVDDTVDVADTTTSVFGAVGNSPRTRALRALVEKRQTIMKDAWLKRTGFIRPDMPEGLPFDEAERKAKEIDAEIGKLLREK